MMILQDEDYCIALKVVGYEGKAKIFFLIKDSNVHWLERDIVVACKKEK